MMRRMVATLLASTLLVVGLGDAASAVRALHTDAGSPVVEMTDGPHQPDLGQFVAPDPARAVLDSATYTYANSNPMTTSDPLGLWPTDGTVGDAVGYVGSNVAGIFGVGVVLQAFRACEGTEKGSCGAEVVAMAVVGGAGKGLGKAARASKPAAHLSRSQGARMTTPQATELANWLGYTRVKNATSHGQAVYTNGKTYISPDVDSHSRGVWKMSSSVDGLGPRQRLGTYDFLLQRIAK